MQTKTEKISLKDKLKFLTAKSIQDNPLILENILGVPVKLKEFSGAWEDYGIFIKDEDRYAFLTREYSNPDENGRGNMIFVSHLNPKDTIVNNESFYIIKFAYGGGAMIYDERDLTNEIHNIVDVGLMEGFSFYDAMLERCGIPKIRKVN